VLQAKITVFNTDLTTYKQALSDLKLVDCATDPAAFQAALLTARASHDTLVKDSGDIKTYVQGTVKPTLTAIKTTLEASEKTTKTSGGTN
jgi:hypothetical protein